MPALRTAIAWPNDKTYLFFDDDTYTRYDTVTGTLEQQGLSVPAQWTGLAGSPGAFVWWGAGKAYAFTGGTYVRYDEPGDRADPDYLPPNPPFTVAGNWTGLPADWQSGFDTAVNWGTGKLYFFKGDGYLRYDITADRADDGYPRPIAGNWNGLFAQDLTAALYSGGRYAYFFRGDDYQRYDVDADAVDDNGTLATLRFEPVPGGGVRPARLLTPQQANQLTTDLITRGILTLQGGAAPAVGQNVAVQPPTLGPVRYTNALNPAAGFFDNVDQRMLIALHRLTRWIDSSVPDVTELRHLGIGHGNGPPNDCHNQGRALDLSGIVGTLDGTPFTKSILQDWGKLPPRTGSTVRIDPSVDALAYQLFSTAYRFATHECEANGIGTGNKWPMPPLGDSGFVIYPDYSGDPGLRQAHQNHIHLQVGRTRV
ncbi:hemopexin [Streptomyces puniciscabiei]|uniref:Hemopexin n=1 Tax=Streptomyces puniciscabiei TaxID=164348 RepID=A0A542UJW1_9ACTN|nr:hemopexin repeat-containing protein [Streptomyces puniciscabiei]TQK99355.1 hemopexin [Streptomyces puniciscabiei]